MKTKIDKLGQYSKDILRGSIIGLGLSFGITAGVISMYAIDWSGVSVVTSGTSLTANLWNTTMSTLTGAIETIDTTVMKLTGNQTIDGTKTFSSPVVGQTPIATNHLTTKAYVDGLVLGIPTGAIMSFYLSSCPTGWILADGTSSTPDLRGAFIRGMGGDANGRDVVRTLGSYQSDEFKSHNHNIIGMNSSGGGSSAYDPPYSGLNPGTITTTSAGGTETRPKNVALIYCMKQ